MPFDKSDSGDWDIDKNDGVYTTWDALYCPDRDVYILVVTTTYGNGDAVDQVVKDIQESIK